MSLLNVLMTRDGYTREEALEAIQEAREMVWDGADPEEVLYSEFGVEPDYIFDII